MFGLTDSRCSALALAFSVLHVSSIAPGTSRERVRPETRSDWTRLVLAGGRTDEMIERSRSRIDTETVIVAPPDSSRDRLTEFHRHVRSNRLGYFIDEAQLDSTHLEYTSDALRRIPGVTVRPARGIGNQVRIRGCAPLIWVDGERAPGAELDDVTHGGDVAALEVYRSQAGVPPEFADRSATCGTIVAWLKSG